MRRMILAWLACVAVTLPARAQFRPEGPPFPVDAGFFMRLAVDESGAVMFAGERENTNPESMFDVYARSFDTQGRPLGPSFLVAQDAEYPDVASTADGTSAVVYVDNGRVPRRVGVSTYSAGATPLGRGSLGEWPSSRLRVAAGRGSERVFIAAWIEDLAGGGAQARVFDQFGVSAGPVFRVDPGRVQPYALDVAGSGAGSFLVFWTEYTLAALRGYARRFDVAGTPLSDEFEIGPFDNACADGSGNFITVRAVLDEFDLWSVFARRFDADGQPRGEWLRVAQMPTPNESGTGASVACDAAGDFIVAWDAGTGTEESDVFARRYHASGVADGPLFRVNRNLAGRQAGHALASGESGNFAVLWWDGAQYGYRAQRYRVSPRLQVKGDFDGDAHADLVWRHMSTGATRLWTMDEGVRTGDHPISPPSPELEWALVGADDFNADGHPDLVMRHTDKGSVYFLLLGGAHGNECLGAVALSGAPELSFDWDLAASADFNHDGRPDLLWQHRLTGALVVWVMDGTAAVGTLTPAPDRAADSNWRVVAALDYDGDGNNDLLWYNEVSGRIVQWLLDTSLRRVTGRFTNPSQVSGGGWRIVAGGDYGIGAAGLAGTNDIVWRNTDTGKLVLWFLDFAGNRTAGMFTDPAAPAAALEWTVVGPR